MKRLIEWLLFEFWLGRSLLVLLERKARLVLVEANQVAGQASCSRVLGVGRAAPKLFVPDNIGMVVSAPRDDPCFSEALHCGAEFWEAETS